MFPKSAVILDISLSCFELRELQLRVQIKPFRNYILQSCARHAGNGGPEPLHCCCCWRAQRASRQCETQSTMTRWASARTQTKPPLRRRTDGRPCESVAVHLAPQGVCCFAHHALYKILWSNSNIATNTIHQLKSTRTFCAANGTRTATLTRRRRRKKSSERCALCAGQRRLSA